MFDMATRTELVMLQKTMVVVEGVARNLDPRLDMWTTAEPVVREWIERNLGPLGRIEEAGRGAHGRSPACSATCPTLAPRPSGVLDQLEDVTRTRLHARTRTSAASGIGRAEARGPQPLAGDRGACWIIALRVALTWHACMVATADPRSGAWLSRANAFCSIIGGGIAAYKVARSDPPPARARRVGALHADRRRRSNS